MAQRDFFQGRALAVMDNKAVLRISGPDRLSWLHSLITQDVLGLRPGVTKESLLLDPQGRIEHAFFLTDDGETAWLLTDKTRVDSLHQWLEKMVFRMDVRIERAPEGAVVVARCDNSHEGDDVVSPLGQPFVSWRDPWPQIEEGSIGYHEGSHPGEGLALRYELFDSISLELLRSLPLLSGEAVEALQIAAGRPTVSDVDEKALPHEYDWLRTAVHLNKGCYRGQETVAKVHNLGHPPRRLTLLHLDGSSSVLPRNGDQVRFGETIVGVITRAARHFEEGPIALALLKRSADTSAILTVDTADGTISATQEVLVPADAGATRSIPKLPRL